MEDTLLKVLNIPIATSGNPLGEYTHINNIIGPAIGVGGTIYNLVTLKSTNFHHGNSLASRGIYALASGSDGVDAFTTLTGESAALCNT